MTLPDISKTLRRELSDAHGRDVTVKTYSFGSENEYGDQTRSLDSTETVKARVQRRRRAEKISRADGEEVEADIRIYFRDDVSDVTHSDSPPQTEYSVDGVEYVAVRVDVEDNGTLAVDCRRKD